MVALIALAAAGCMHWTDPADGTSASDSAAGSPFAIVDGDSSVSPRRSAASFTGRSVASGATVGTPTFDGGVVLAGVPTHLCVPVAAFGWSEPEGIERIESSCDCASPRLVRYWTRAAHRIESPAVTGSPGGSGEATEITQASESNSAYGVLVSFSEKSESDSTFHPTPLLIELTAHYSDGQSRTGRLRVLHTRGVEDVAESAEVQP